MKPLYRIGSSLKDLREMPEDVQDEFGYALFLAQDGGMHRSAKPLKRFSGAGVIEVVKNHAGDTYRAIYTVKFSTAWGIFQKKSKRVFQK